MDDEPEHGRGPDAILGTATLVAVRDHGSALGAFTPEQVETTCAFVSASRAASTRAKYEQHWAAFALWCREHGHQAMPTDPALVAVHLSALAAAGLAPQTLALRLAAISHAHRQAGESVPHKARGGTVVLDVLAGARCAWGRPPARKAAADGDMLWAMLHEIKGDTLKAVRDRALLSFGMVSCMRRSEITAGRRLKPVQHLETWLERAAVTEGPLFRRLSQCATRVLADRMSDRSVAEIVKARVKAAGLNPAVFAGHSLRAGFLTSAARAGATIWKMQEQSRHKSLNVLSGYVRSARLFEDHAGKDFA